MPDTKTTRPVESTLTWEQYCAALEVDVTATREASVPRALLALMGGQLRAPRVPRIEES